MDEVPVRPSAQSSHNHSTEVRRVRPLLRVANTTLRRGQTAVRRGHSPVAETRPNGENRTGCDSDFPREVATPNRLVPPHPPLSLTPSSPQVSPSEIESVLLDDPAVERVGVAGVVIPGVEGRVPRAFIVLKGDRGDKGDNGMPLKTQVDFIRLVESELFGVIRHSSFEIPKRHNRMQRRCRPRII